MPLLKIILNIRWCFNFNHQPHEENYNLLHAAVHLLFWLIPLLSSDLRLFLILFSFCFRTFSSNLCLKSRFFTVFYENYKIKRENFLSFMKNNFSTCNICYRKAFPFLVLKARHSGLLDVVLSLLLILSIICS